jgi:hypothetical protein
MLDVKTRMLVKNLIDQLDMESCLKNSFKNYHTEGLYYINLFRDEKLTIKLYFMMPGIVQNANSGYLVSPHSHAYNFSTQVLFGEVQHVIFKEDEDGRGWHKFTYESNKKPEDRFIYRKEVGLKAVGKSNYYTGEDYYLDTTQVHSLIVPEATITCLLLHQYADTELNGTQFFSTSPEKPSSKNAYSTFTEHEVNLLLKLLKKRIGIS